MKKQEAKDMARRLNNLDSPVIAVVVRILPEDIDPPQLGDSGWDVEVTPIEDKS